MFVRQSPSLNRFFPELAALTEGGCLPTRAPGATFPAIDAFEDVDAVRVVAELPGYRMNDLKITLEGAELSISGAHKDALPEGSTALRRERNASTSFGRTLRVGVPIDASKVTATLDAGLLTVVLPKSEAAKPRTIEVKAAS